MREISTEIARALQPVMDARLDETIQVLRPLFVDDAAARGAAVWTTPYFSQLCGYCSRGYGRALIRSAAEPYQILPGVLRRGFVRRTEIQL